MANAKMVPIKYKIFALVASLIVLVVAVISWRAYVIFKEDKGAFVKDLSAKLATSTTRTLENRMNGFQDKLIIFISNKESLNRTGAKQEDQMQVLFSRYQEFLSVGLAKPSPNGGFAVDWFVRNPTEVSVQWPANYEKKQINGGAFDFMAAERDGRYLARAKDPDGKNILILGFQVDVVDVKKAKQKSVAAHDGAVKAWILGVMPDKAFDDVIADLEAGVSRAFIIDDKGNVIAHTDRKQKGTELRALPLVAEMISGKKTSSAGEYEDANGETVIAGYELLPHFNVGVAVMTPKAAAFAAANEMAEFIFFIAVIILVLALGFAIFFSNLLTAPLKQLSELAKRIGGGDFKVDVNVKSHDEIGLLANSFQTMGAELQQREEALAGAQQALVQSEKMSAFGQLSAGIAHEVKNPLAGILGHAQLAMGKAQSDDMKKHLEVIEKETRRCKTIIESLMKFARAEKTQLVPTDLAEVVQSTIDLVDHQLSLAGCKILKEISSSVPKVQANGNQLQQVLLNLMMNASHAMEGRPVKNVTVRLLQVEDKAQIQIEDTGTGIPPHIQKKIFEPFFTTKPAGKGTGLGLSVSIGIVKEHKGEIYIKSKEGEGTTFFIDIPINADAAIGESKPVIGTALVPSAPRPQAQAEQTIPAEPVTGTTAAHDILPKPGLAAVSGSKNVSAKPSGAFSKLPKVPPAPAPKKSEPTLGGKVPVTEAAKLPPAPNEDEPASSTSTPPPAPKPDLIFDLDAPLGGGAGVRRPSLRPKDSPPPAEAVREAAFDSGDDFKVKIRKPKIKA